MPIMDLTNLTIAILYSETGRPSHGGRLINLLKPYWDGWGAKIVELQGTQNYVPADIIIVHVDLSVVPIDYQRFAQQYPRQINADVLDIRKSSVCDHLLSANDPYSGRVLAKTDLNYAGLPEAVEAHLSQRKPNRTDILRYLARKANSARMKLVNRSSPIKTKRDYRVFQNLGCVPNNYRREDIVLQKFMPEFLGEKYVLREYYFLGNIGYINVEVSDDPIFTTGEQIETFIGAPPAAVTALCEKLNLGYGKIDYAIHNNEAVVFDVNKTVGTVGDHSVGAGKIAQALAAGIFFYLK
jgi:hypothetical protein